MKRKAVAVAALAAVILICSISGGYLMFKKIHTDKNSVTDYESVFLRESKMRGSSEYEIINKGETSEVSLYRIYYSGGDEERRLEARKICDSTAVIDILNKCGVLSWDGFHGAHPKNVSDGTMFSFEAKINDGSVIKADGSANFPKNYNLLNQWLYESLKDG